MRCLAAWLITAAALLASAGGRAAELDLIQDKSTAFMLNAMEILEEGDGPGPLSLRIIRVNDAGECATGREAATCPRGRLLIAVATQDAGPHNPAVWRTERHIGWSFVRWLEPRKDASGAELSLFEAKDCEAAPEIENGHRDPRKGGWWREVHYEIGVNLKHAIIQKLLPEGKPTDCNLE
jgi:hypothetical protein